MIATRRLRPETFLAVALVVVSSIAAAAQTPSDTAPVPTFAVDPFWPNLPEPFLMGAVRGLSVDSRDHVWVAQDSNALTDDQTGAAEDPPQAECCRPAPPVMEFDAEGNYVQGWGGPGEGYEWPLQIHGLFVDHQDNVWISSERQGESHLLKFTRNGEFVMQIGRRGAGQGSHDTENVGGAANMVVHPGTNELFVADGYGNRRVVVFDADTGEYKRHLGAYGQPPDDSVELTRRAEGDGASQFNLVHDVRISNDDLVYVADRNNHRIQVFTLQGEFVKEAFVARESFTRNGTVYALGFSNDPGQRFLYVADPANGRIRILDRDSLEPLGHFGRWGRQAGQLMVPHNLDTDSGGNLYVGEIREGRVQKFVLERMPE